MLSILSILSILSLAGCFMRASGGCPWGCQTPCLVISACAVAETALASTPPLSLLQLGDVAAERWSLPDVGLLRLLRRRVCQLETPGPSYSPPSGMPSSVSSC